MSHNSSDNRYDDRLQDPIYSLILYNSISASIVGKEKLRNSDFLEFHGIPYYYDAEPTVFDKTLLYYSIGEILSINAHLIKEHSKLLEESLCYLKNLPLSIQYSPTFKTAYNTVE